MKRTRAEMKTSLLAQIENELDLALDWQEKTERPNLTEFEDQVLSIRKSIGMSVLKEVLKDEESDQPAEIYESYEIRVSLSLPPRGAFHYELRG